MSVFYFMISKTVFLVLLMLSIFAHGNEVDCDNAINTLETNFCINKEVELAESELSLYIAKATERYINQPTVIKALRQSQQDWLAYRQSYCNGIYEIWSDGTIRGVMFGECMQKLTKQRTHKIWEDYLTFMDSTTPLLPEPN